MKRGCSYLLLWNFQVQIGTNLLHFIRNISNISINCHSKTVVVFIVTTTVFLFLPIYNYLPNSEFTASSIRSKPKPSSVFSMRAAMRSLHRLPIEPS